MRSSLTLLIAAVASFVPSANAATPLSLSINLSAGKVLYGHTLTLSGRLSSGRADHPVTVAGQLLGQAMRPIATVETGVGGTWSLRVEPPLATSYRARSGALLTPALGVAVVPALSTRVLPDGEVWAHVSGPRVFTGRLVELQQAKGTGWKTVAWAPLDRQADALLPAPLTHGSLRVRVAMSVNEAGRGLLGAASDPFIDRGYRARPLELSSPGSSTVFGRSLTLVGRVPNGRAGEAVTISARAYGRPELRLGAVVSGAGGRFAWRVSPRIETAYRARFGSQTSRMLVIGVRPEVAVSRLRDGRLAVRVAPSGVFAGRNVELQRRSAHGWATIAELPLAGRSGSAVFTPPALGDSGATLRVAMSVNEAGPGYLESTSRPIVYQARSISIGPASASVLYGHALRLSGRISSHQAGQRVVILARRYGRPAPQEGVAVLTGPGGRWSFEAAPSIETSYLARWGASVSRTLTVGVEPRVTVLVLRNGLIATRLAAGRPLRGRFVELQALMPAGRWSTIMRMPLDRRSSAVFAPGLGATVATLRIAMSVNQAGPGLLGARSHAFEDRSV